MTTPTYGHRDRCAIAGIGATEFSKDSGVSELSLATAATLDALADAGLTTADVDGIVRCDSDLVSYTDLAESLGLENLSYTSTVGPGGIAPAGMVAQAVGAILSGQATSVVVFRCLNGRSGRRFGAGSPAAQQARVGGRQSWDEFFLPWGLVTPGQFFALLAQRHMTEFGTTHEQLGRIAVACRERANANPAAQMHDRVMTLDDYLDSPMIAEPLRLFDFCLETDGANALVVTTAERARDLRQPPALIRAVAQGVSRGGQGGAMWPVLVREDALQMASRQVAARLYGRAGLDHGAAAVRGLRVLRAGRGRPVRRERRRRPRRPVADQHVRRTSVGGIHPRHEPRRRRRPSGSRHVDVPGPARRGQPRHVRAADRRQRPPPDDGSVDPR
jgi:acetyl-CoA acetyltransferase